MDKKNKNNLQSEKIRLEYENKKLREELKEFAKKLDLAVERKIYKKEKVKKEQTLMREIKDFEEIMKFYQNEKKVLKARLEMVADVGYEEKLKKDVQKFNARLQNLEKATKIGEYFRKKTECYLHDYSAELSRENEMKSLNMKKYHLLKVTKTLHSTIETNQKAIAESNEKLKLLEKKYKILQPSSSSPSPHKSRIKKRIEYISKKHFTLEKQKCSNSTLLLSKINNLKTELNYLKQDEMEISLQIDSKYEIASEMQAQIKKSVSSSILHNKPSLRSTSVEPHKKILNEINISTSRYLKSPYIYE